MALGDQNEDSMHSHVRLRVDLSALVANYRLLSQRASPSECGAVVKADGYGLGLPQVSTALADAGCKSFFVSEVFEGIALRNSLPDAEIFVLSGISPSNAHACLSTNLTPVLGNSTQVDIWRRLAGCKHPAALKVDTGMTRLGLCWDEMATENLRGLHINLLMTHLACADTPSHPLNQTQIERFEQVRRAFPSLRTSIGNSAGTFTGASTRGDLCRCGIGIFGGNPFSTTDNPFRTVAYLEAKVLQITTLSQDETVGYGASYRAAHDCLIATLGAGYANGLPRALSNLGHAAHAQETFPIIGRISMNLTALRLSRESGLEMGDWVQLIGDVVKIDEVARLADTISHEVLTGLRAPRTYFKG